MKQILLFPFLSFCLAQRRNGGNNKINDHSRIHFLPSANGKVRQTVVQSCNKRKYNHAIKDSLKYNYEGNYNALSFRRLEENGKLTDEVMELSLHFGGEVVEWFKKKFEEDSYNLKTNEKLEIFYGFDHEHNVAKTQMYHTSFLEDGREEIFKFSDYGKETKQTFFNDYIRNKKFSRVKVDKEDHGPTQVMKYTIDFSVPKHAFNSNLKQHRISVMEYFDSHTFVDYYLIKKENPEIVLFNNKYYFEEFPQYKAVQNVLGFSVTPTITEEGNLMRVHADFELLHRVRQIVHQPEDLFTIEIPMFTKFYSNVIKPELVEKFEFEDSCLFRFWQEAYVGSLIQGDEAFQSIKVITPNSAFKKTANWSTIISAILAMLFSIWIIVTIPEPKYSKYKDE